MAEEQRIDWDAKRRNRGIELAKSIADYVNDMGHKKEPFTEELLNCTHRTLQQSAMQMMFYTIAEMAKKYETGVYDLRNEQACKTAAEIHKFMSESSPLGEKWWFCPSI